MLKLTNSPLSLALFNTPPKVPLKIVVLKYGT